MFLDLQSPPERLISTFETPCIYMYSCIHCRMKKQRNAAESKKSRISRKFRAKRTRRKQTPPNLRHPTFRSSRKTHLGASSDRPLTNVAKNASLQKLSRNIRKMQIRARAIEVAYGSDNEIEQEDDEEVRTARILRIRERRRLVRCMRVTFATTAGGFGPICLDCEDEPLCVSSALLYIHHRHQLVAYEPTYTGLTEKYRCQLCRQPIARLKPFTDCYGCLRKARYNSDLYLLRGQAEVATLDTEDSTTVTLALRQEENGATYHVEVNFQC